MKKIILEQVATAASALKLDLSAEEFALLAEGGGFSETGLEAVQALFLSQRKETADHHPDFVETESSSHKGPQKLCEP